MNKRGPKPPPDLSPLPFSRSGDDVLDFTRFCEKYIRVEQGNPMMLLDWQIRIVEMVWGDPRPKLAGLSIGRGNSKSSLCAAMCLYQLYLNRDFSIDLLAYDERQAGLIGKLCARMIARHPQLAKRASIYSDHIAIGSSELYWLPAIPAAIEGRLVDAIYIDEGGRVDRAVYEVAAFTVTKKPHAQLFLIGTPGPKADSVLAEFREQCLANPDDPSQRYMEFSADQWRDHPVDCDDHGGGEGTGCLTAANPALGHWLTRESLLSTLPPKMTENHWRRVRLVQFWATGADDPFVTGPVWDALGTGVGVPPGVPVVLALDGSVGGKDSDTTALVVATITPKPHFDVVNVWANVENDPGWRVPVLAVEDAIRAACRQWNVKELVIDPFRWNRSGHVLAAEGITVSEFPWQPTRVTKATVDLHHAIVNNQLSHSGNPVLRAHMLAATVTENDGGLRLAKASRSRQAARIDCAAALLMAHSRASWLASQKPKPRKAYSFR